MLFVAIYDTLGTEALRSNTSLPVLKLNSARIILVLSTLMETLVTKAVTKAVKAVTVKAVTSMIGKSQGETEIPLDSAEWVPRARR
jgi:hypothetical protein